MAHPNTQPSKGLYAQMGGEIDRLTAENEELRKQVELLNHALEPELAQRHAADIEAQMRVWRFMRECILANASRYGITPVPWHEVARRVQSAFCSTLPEEDLSYYRELNELFAHIADDCEQEADKLGRQRMEAQAPKMAVAFNSPRTDQLNIGSNNIRYQ